MNGASPLLELPEHVWDVIFDMLPVPQDKCSACLASSRFWRWWANETVQSLQGASMGLSAGRFTSRRAASKACAAAPLELAFDLERDSAWLQLLHRFLACAAGPSFTSFLQPRPGKSCAEPHLWLTVPPGFKENSQPGASVAEGHCVGHLPRGTSITICLVMSGRKRSFYFQLPRVRLLLGGSAAAGTAEARLQLLQVRPVLEPALEGG